MSLILNLATFAAALTFTVIGSVRAFRIFVLDKEGDPCGALALVWLGTALMTTIRHDRAIEKLERAVFPEPVQQEQEADHAD